MLLPLAQLLEGREPPLCVQQTALVKDALKLMLKNDISQLPVVDEDGDLIGIISHKTVTHALFLLADRVPLLDLTIDHCLERVDTLTLDDDVFEACDTLRAGTGFLVVTAGHKPAGIITSGDLMSFFRDRSEDFIKIADIELTLRLRTRDAFPDDPAMEQALLVALGPDPGQPARPRKDFDELNLGELVLVMTHAENWPHFDGMFEPLELFRLLMDRVRQVRNLLAHFRGQTDLIQDRTLRYAIDWLSLRARPAQTTGPRRAEVLAADIAPRTSSGRWDPLRDWLARQRPEASGIRVGFSDLQTLLGGPLPSSALKHASWWSNNPHEAQASAWRDAGWQVAKVDVTRREVVFQPLASAAGGSTPENDQKVAFATS